MGAPLPIRQSLSWKLSRQLVVLLLGVGAWFTFAVTHIVKKSYDTSQQLSARAIVKDLADRIEPLLEGDIDLWALQRTADRANLTSSQFGLYVLDAHGTILIDLNGEERSGTSVAIEPFERLLRARSEADLPVYIATPMARAGPSIFAVEPISVQTRPGFLLLVGSRPDWETTTGSVKLRLYRWVVGAALVPSLLCGILVGLFFIRKLSRRIADLSTGAQRFAGGDLTVRLRFDVPDELGSAVSAFNAMADSIEKHVGELSRRDQLRRELISNISHDLRSPLAVIRGYCESLQPENTEVASGIERGAESLNLLLNQLTELARIETHEVIPKTIPFRLDELASEMIVLYRDRAEKKGIRLFLHVEGGEAGVLADPMLLERVFSNLLENALRYTEAGGEIQIRLVLRGFVVDCEVVDSGHGVAPEDAPHIFERNFQGQSTSAETQELATPGSCGLGLAIVRGIIRAHGSEIIAERVLPRGMSFRFSLPRAPEATDNRSSDVLK